MMQDTADVVRGQLPYLRRYARALTGDQTAGDRMVRDALVALSRVGQPPQLDRLELFRALHRAAREDPGGARDRDPEAVIALRLDRLAPELRRYSDAELARDGLFAGHDFAALAHEEARRRVAFAGG
jgi:hypothetical protein